jgi:hypothetical protein
MEWFTTFVQDLKDECKRAKKNLFLEQTLRSMVYHLKFKYEDEGSLPKEFKCEGVNSIWKKLKETGIIEEVSSKDKKERKIQSESMKKKSVSINHDTDPTDMVSILVQVFKNLGVKYEMNEKEVSFEFVYEVPAKEQNAN